MTQNLGAALPYLRLKDRDRVLWIDAICVNQQNLEERSQQVERTAEIYSKASKVVAWLGPSTARTATAIRCLNTITHNVKGNWELSEFQSISNDESWADERVAPPLKDDEYFAIAEFLSSEWFGRLWIYQEIRLSSVRSILLCGHHSLGWEPFRSAAYFLFRKLHLAESSESIFLQSRVIRSITNLCKYSGYQPLEFLLSQTEQCQCSDPRDRIFALLSLTPESHRGYGTKPDYTKSPQEVYTDAFKSIISTRMNLTVLLNVEMHVSLERTPSWAPDWSLPRNSTLLATSNASSFTRVIPKFPSKGIMQVEGIIVDSIETAELCQLPEILYTLAGTLELKRAVMRLLPTSSERGNLNLRSLCRTLLAGQFSERYAPPSASRPGLSQTEETLRQILCTPQEAWATLDGNAVGYIGMWIRGRCVYRSSRQHIGLAPQATRQGDVVAVLLGCPNPMILRPTVDCNFKVVGEAYCDEFDDGPALMGPLPGNFKLVMKWNEQKEGYYFTFLNSETRSLQVEDPRLSQVPLPLGWRKVSHEFEGYWMVFVNVISGQRIPYDPRLTAEALKQRGVDIRTFNLV